MVAKHALAFLTDAFFLLIVFAAAISQKTTKGFAQLLGTHAQGGAAPIEVTHAASRNEQVEVPVAQLASAIGDLDDHCLARDGVRSWVSGVVFALARKL